MVKRLFVYALGLVSLWQTTASAQSVLTYHNSVSRQGSYVVPDLTTQAASGMHIDAAFKGIVDGSVYAQPLFWQPPGTKTSQVIVATETNKVYALDSVTGAVDWQTQLAPPIANGLPCGNINPEGITGTPVIDPSNGTMYLDASTMGPAGIRHMLYGLSLKDGHVLPGWPIDIQTKLNANGVDFSSLVQGNRTAVLEVNGDIYFSYAGRSGDCGAYHGTVVQLNTHTAALAGVWQTVTTGGGIWSQGGVVQDGSSLFFVTGNDFSVSQWGGGQSIIRSKPGLSFSYSSSNHYTPANWIQLDDHDFDLGGSGVLPLHIPTGRGQTTDRLIGFGKDGNAYLVNPADLGGIGGPAVINPIGRGVIITAASAYYTPDSAMVALTAPAANYCDGQSVIMLNVAGAGPNPIRQEWCQKLNGQGTPIVTTTDGASNPIVWVTGAEGDNQLHGYDAMSGRVVFDGGGTANTMSGLQHFQTILAAQGKLYVAGKGRIYAFTH